jgi:hypothetical protein
MVLARHLGHHRGGHQGVWKRHTLTRWAYSERKLLCLVVAFSCLDWQPPRLLVQGVSSDESQCVGSHSPSSNFWRWWRPSPMVVKLMEISVPSSLSLKLLSDNFLLEETWCNGGGVFSPFCSVEVIVSPKDEGLHIS